jgi:soluble lytic murein transglycosylase-like protein
MKLRKTTVLPLAASLGGAFLLWAGGARAAEANRLRQWVDKNGVTHLDDGQKPPVSEIRQSYVDSEGAPHFTIGPSRQARHNAQRLTLAPMATGKAARVHETSDFDAPIADASRKYNLPQELIRAVIVVESNFHPDAVSRVGARGLMQLMPGTAAAMYVHDLADPVDNIFGGTRYLRILANTFDGDLIKTIAAYNAGPDAVRKASGVPRIAETQSYVERVNKLYRIYRGL